MQDQPMNNVYELEQTYQSLSSRSITPSEEEEDRLSFSRTLFTCRRQKKKGKASNLSPTSTLSLQNNCDSFCRAKEITNNTRILKIARNTSIISSKKTRPWKQNDGGFQCVLLTNDNNDYITRSSSSSSTPAAADRRIRRQRRKQTRLKRKTGSEKRNEKRKKKKERNKKSPSSSTTGAEATEASLFQFFTLDTSTIDTSAIFYPYEQQAKCADKNRPTQKKENCFSVQTSGEHHQQQKQEVYNTHYFSFFLLLLSPPFDVSQKYNPSLCHFFFFHGFTCCSLNPI